jgi:hypothetical protein
MVGATLKKGEIVGWLSLEVDDYDTALAVVLVLNRLKRRLICVDGDLKPRLLRVLLSPLRLFASAYLLDDEGL